MRGLVQFFLFALLFPAVAHAQPPQDAHAVVDAGQRAYVVMGTADALPPSWERKPLRGHPFALLHVGDRRRVAAQRFTIVREGRSCVGTSRSRVIVALAEDTADGLRVHDRHLYVAYELSSCLASSDDEELGVALTGTHTTSDAGMLELTIDPREVRVRIDGVTRVCPTPLSALPPDETLFANRPQRFFEPPQR